MKKIITLFVIVGMISLQGCTPTPELDLIDNDTIGTVFETNEVSFTPGNSFTIRYTFPRPIFSSDMVLVYRLAGSVNGNDLWEFLPETYYFANGTRDFAYNFNFTRTFVDVYLNGNDLISVPASNRLNQVFRIVVVPAMFGASFKSKNYFEVITALNINESQIKRINL
jgi:hypothetical protein